MTTTYLVEWTDSGSVDRRTGNVDVYVTFEDGSRFTATFFTLENVAGLMERYRHTGECGSGMYFWASNMIIVSALTEEIVRATIADLIATGEFEVAFSPA